MLLLKGVLSDWKFWTYTDYYNDCMSFAKTLVHLKVDKFKIVNILGFNAVILYILFIVAVIFMPLIFCFKLLVFLLFIFSLPG